MAVGLFRDYFDFGQLMTLKVSDQMVVKFNLKLANSKFGQLGISLKLWSGSAALGSVANHPNPDHSIFSNSVFENFAFCVLP